MAELTLDALTDLLRRAAGEGEDVDLDGDILDVPFTELGYDSLAVLELAGMLERDYLVSLSDDAVQEAKTPGQLITLVNSLPAQA
ncbi:acyl carrier protein [Yinghuangia sp. ASG 101]|uniref:acyl carrier protein n=1 Tax=Yinghuangia sp. ASG 101 TaxID=2896848 RepID=UPI001E4C858A|nr:acyl carrier protein [Yinghuangia sp. ASG 101]UGQ11793.1 acyl carrier protein [Yinghuangia sp. ASG 101]